MLISPASERMNHGNIVQFMCKVLKCLDKTSQDNDFVEAGDTHSFGDHLSDHQSFMSIGVELIGGENRA